MRTLMPQQKKALDWAKDRARIALYMEMRLGKSAVAIRWAETNRFRKVLLLGPVAVLNGWAKELREELFADEEIIVLEGSVPSRVAAAMRGKAGWYLTNYETVTHGQTILDKSAKWDAVILDESTRIKNPKADITRILINECIRQDIKGRAVLSGLPAPESEMDYCEQMRFLFNGNFMHEHNFWWWRKKYYYQAGYDWLPRTGSLEKINKAIAEAAFVMTAEEAGLGKKAIYETLSVELDKEQKKAYKTVANDFEFKAKDKPMWAKHIVVKLGWLQQICGGVGPDGKTIGLNKIRELLNLLEGDLKGKSVVIWFKYNAEIDLVRHHLEDSKIKCAIFTGEEKESEEDFLSGKIKIMLAQQKCGRFGLNWSVADTAIYYSCHWSWEDRKQSEKRIEHAKKNKPLLYIDLTVPDSIDSDVRIALRIKGLSQIEFTNRLIKAMEQRCQD